MRVEVEAVHVLTEEARSQSEVFLVEKENLIVGRVDPINIAVGLLDGGQGRGVHRRPVQAVGDAVHRDEEGQTGRGEIGMRVRNGVPIVRHIQRYNGRLDHVRPQEGGHDRRPDEKKVRVV